MKDAGILVIKGLNGGLFVVAFALLGEALEPKRFAGLFAAAPSVALANLTVVLVTKTHRDGVDNVMGMTVGAIGFVGYALLARRLMDSLGTARGVTLAIAIWLAVAAAGFGLFLR
jgi:uncharacterized membrane protein (GlpM family)